MAVHGLVTFILLMGVLRPSLGGDAPGYELFMGGTTNLEEMEDYPLKFDNPLPTWLRGTLVRNGGGRYEVGDANLTSLFDGFAKMHSCSFRSNGTFFSAKFLRTSFYNESVAENDVAPYLTVGPVRPPFTLEKKLKAMENNMDNPNVNIYNFTSDMVVLNDVWTVYTLDVGSLEVKEKVSADLPNAGIGFPYFSKMSSAHPVPEPGTGNHLTFMVSVAILPGLKHMMTLVRVKSTKEREVIAQWFVEKVSYMHSFSVTEQHAVLIASPFFFDLPQMMTHLSVEGAMKWENDVPSTIYVVNLKTGDVQSFQTETMFTMHHINAFYVKSNDSIAMDVVAYNEASAFSSASLDVIRNATARNRVLSPTQIKRYTISLKHKKVNVEVFRNFSVLPETAQIELPTINENYRSKRYCFVYGLVGKADNKNASCQSVIKKSLCNSSDDRSWHVDDHYLNEAWFVPRPGAIAEDDGVLMFPAFDGVNKTSYLTVLDAKTMTLLSKAVFPTRVPFTFHGRFIPSSL